MDSGIFYFKDNVTFRLNNKNSISRWIRRIIMLEGRNLETINLIFCTDESILKINKKYLHHNYFTDVITFDYSNNKGISGDVYISIDRVRENAISYKVGFNAEICRVIIHGVLHLLGYSDKTPGLKKQMRTKEDACLSLLKFHVKRKG